MTDAVEGVSPLTRLAEAFGKTIQERESFANAAACSAFHSIVQRIDGNLDGALQRHMEENPESIRYGLEDQQQNVALYVEIGPRSDGQDSRRVSLVYQENGKTIVQAYTERSNLSGPVGNVVLEQGNPEIVRDLIKALNSAIPGRNHFTRLEIRDPKVEEIRALRCC